MLRGILYVLARLFVLLVAVMVYLLLLPIQISTESGFSVTLPDLIRFSDVGLAFPDPINWTYVLLIPVPLIIIVIGYEVVRLLFGSARR
ncbi:MAG: hypothetical protein DYG88_10570 [Chloroflexi bacterium CFX4]|nr:hypothetical protein [Chloroflexi bacterium CFX4]MDL1923323.1 hypothetical protein [Chloroflexi bacterium CFX3]